MNAASLSLAGPLDATRPDRASRAWLAWAVFAIAALAAPLFFGKGAAVTVLSQMGAAVVFALSYNMLLGQTGMLSFGHSVFSGTGAYLAIHALILAGRGSLPVPVSLLPLVGGLGGLVVAVILGSLITRRSGTAFAMITTGIVELVYALAHMYPGFFGGESGITANRVVGEPVAGITFGSEIQVYYLVVAWLFFSVFAMHAFTATPLGRMANAVRDNAERVEFIGYSARTVRYFVLMVSGFFAGVSGGLSAIIFEIVAHDAVGVVRSGDALLYAVIGGIGTFTGPIVGAIAGVLLTVKLSDFTRAWPLYLGLIFIVMVMYVPHGLTGLLADLAALLRRRASRPLLAPVALVTAAVLLGACGIFVGAETLYAMHDEAKTVPARQWVHAVSGGSPAVAGALCAGLVLSAVLLGVPSRRLLQRRQDAIQSQDEAAA